MAKMTYCEAIRNALFSEMKRDENVILMGEDVKYNMYRYCEGLSETFGNERVRDTPLSEAAVVGTGIGAALTGLRPIIDLTMTSFLYVAMDQIVSMASKMHYQYGGQYSVPITILVGSTYGRNAAAQHSDRPHSMFMNVPGLKIIAPSCPKDMYGLLKAAIRDNNPVICFEDRTLFPVTEDVPEDCVIPIGKAEIKREGKDISLIGISGCVDKAMEAAEMMSKEGISCEVIDVRTLVPLDKEAILNSVKKTKKAVIIDLAHKTCSAASEIAAILASEGFYFLEAPVGIVATPDILVPFSNVLESEMFPNAEKIVLEVKKVLFDK